MDITRIVSSRLREARERRGWGRLELASRALLTERALVAYEGGHRSPSFEILARLAEALGVARGWLLGDEEAPPSPEAVESLLATDAGRDAVLGGLSLFVSNTVARRHGS